MAQQGYEIVAFLLMRIMKAEVFHLGLQIWAIGLLRFLIANQSNRTRIGYIEPAFASIPHKCAHRQTKTLRQRAYDPALTCLIYLGLKYLFNLRSVFRNCLLRRSAAEIVLLTRLYRNV